MPYPVAVIVRVLMRRIVSLITKNHAISFWINWKTCIAIHSVVMDAMHEIRLTKYAHGISPLLLCSEPYKVNISCHYFIPSFLELAARYCAACCFYRVSVSTRLCHHSNNSSDKPAHMEALPIRCSGNSVAPSVVVSKENNTVYDV